jgi:DNA repair exonuclease SbcCD nuclease subunit
MATEFDASEFVDREFEAAQRSFRGTTAMSALPDDASRAPTRDEVDSKVGDLQSKLAELKRAQSALEQERGALEETRRRQTEFTTGREEMIHNLTRGIGLLEESEFAARRDAEQMARTLAELREALNKVQALNDQAWTKDSFQVELTRANTMIENARMEWNSARLKWAVLSPENLEQAAAKEVAKTHKPLAERSFMELCRFGLALTWPILLGIAALVAVLLLR